MSSKPYTGTAYAWSFLALIILATSSAILASIPLGWAQAPVAMGIASIKALIILSIFMGLARRQASTRMAMLIAAIFVLVLSGFMAMDVLTRQTSRSGETPHVGTSHSRTTPPARD